MFATCYYIRSRNVNLPNFSSFNRKNSMDVNKMPKRAITMNRAFQIKNKDGLSPERIKQNYRTERHTAFSFLDLPLLKTNIIF